MNDKLNQLVLLCTEETGDYQFGSIPQLNPEKFANAIIQQMVDYLNFHGYDDAISYINWYKINKLGLK